MAIALGVDGQLGNRPDQRSSCAMMGRRPLGKHTTRTDRPHDMGAIGAWQKERPPAAARHGHATTVLPPPCMHVPCLPVCSPCRATKPAYSSVRVRASERASPCQPSIHACTHTVDLPRCLPLLVISSTTHGAFLSSHLLIPSRLLQRLAASYEHCLV